jgi:ribosomal protein S18 acetylase RimI-like enzyme
MTPMLRSFAAADQDAARSLILEGLGGHFGFIDESMNPDLDDIQTAYLDTGACFVVAEVDGNLAGTGALTEEEPGVGRLVRMSVSPAHRGKGLGRALVNYLLDEARSRGYHQVVCETNHDWHDAIGLYRACGFFETGVGDGDRHFRKDVEPLAQQG